MDQLLTPGAAQPEIPSVHTLNLASNAMNWLAVIEGSLMSIQHMLEQLFPNNQICHLRAIAIIYKHKGMA
jgi:hypothetical protein